MKEDILTNNKGYMIKLMEFDAFFKDFSETDSVKEDQFNEIYSFYEQKVFEKAAVLERGGSDTKQSEVEIEEEVEGNADAYHYMEEVIIGGDQDDDNDNDNDGDKDPEVSLQDIIDHIVDTNSLATMKPDQLRKIFNKIKLKVDQVNEKMQDLEKKSSKYKTQNEKLKSEKEYFQKKVKDMKEKNEALKESKYKLECDVEDLMKFEKEFQRIVKQSEEKDIEIMKLEDDLDDYKRKIRSLEMRQRSENEVISGSLTKDGLLDRIKNLELELNSYKSYAAFSLPKNKDFAETDYRTSLNQVSPTSSQPTQFEEKPEMSQEPQDKYNSGSELSKLIDELTEQNKQLSESEQKALFKFEKEYKRKLRAIEETEKIKVELENQLALIMVENEALVKENNWRKDFNISNAKEIETYVKDNKILKRKIQDLENEITNWKFKYENQELIKKNMESNPQFQQSYIDMFSQKTEDAYKGRLSQVVKVTANARFTERSKERAKIGTVITKQPVAQIKEEDNEEDHEASDDNLADELGELEGYDQPDFGGLEQREGEGEGDELFEQNAYNDDIIRESQFDRERFTVKDKDRSSHINIGVAPKNFKGKTQLEVIDEDEYYDPIKEQLQELKKETRANKDKVIASLGIIRDEEEESKEDTENNEEDKSEEDYVPELPPPKESKAQLIQDKVRATVAFVTKKTTKAAETQTSFRVEEVKIDDVNAFVIYESIDVEQTQSEMLESHGFDNEF